MGESIVVIGTHLINYSSNCFLTDLISEIKKKGLEYGIVANSLVPDVHYKESKFFMYDSENDKFDQTTWNFWFENEKFVIESPYLFYGAIPNYSFGANNLFIDSVLLSRRYEYKYLHWVEYDSPIYIEEIRNNEEIFKSSDFSCVLYETGSEGYLHGGFISLDLEKINFSNFLKPREERIEKLKKLGFSGENFTKYFLLKDEKIYCKSGSHLENRFNQAFQNPVEFIFVDDNGEIFLFLKNNSSTVFNYNFKTNLGRTVGENSPQEWCLRSLGMRRELDYIYFEGERESFFIDLSIDSEFEKYIGKNKITRK